MSAGRASRRWEDRARCTAWPAALIVCVAPRARTPFGFRRPMMIETLHRTEAEWRLLLPPDRRGSRGPSRRDGPHRGRVYPLRESLGTGCRRRSRTHRPALLRELGVVEVRAGRRRRRRREGVAVEALADGLRRTPVPVIARRGAADDFEDASELDLYVSTLYFARPRSATGSRYIGKAGWATCSGWAVAGAGSSMLPSGMSLSLLAGDARDLNALRVVTLNPLLMARGKTVPLADGNDSSRLYS